MSSSMSVDLDEWFQANIRDESDYREQLMADRRENHGNKNNRAFNMNERHMLIRVLEKFPESRSGITANRAAKAEYDRVTDVGNKFLKEYELLPKYGTIRDNYFLVGEDDNKTVLVETGKGKCKPLEVEEEHYNRFVKKWNESKNDPEYMVCKTGLQRFNKCIKKMQEASHLRPKSLQLLRKSIVPCPNNSSSNSQNNAQGNAIIPAGTSVPGTMVQAGLHGQAAARANIETDPNALAQALAGALTREVANNQGTQHTINFTLNNYQGTHNETHIGQQTNIHGDQNNQTNNNQGSGHDSRDLREILEEIKIRVDCLVENNPSPVKAGIIKELANFKGSIDEDLEEVKTAVKAARKRPFSPPDGANLAGKFEEATEGGSKNDSPTANKDHLLCSKQEYINFGDIDSIRDKLDQEQSQLEWARPVMEKLKSDNVSLPTTEQTSFAELKKLDALELVHRFGQNIIQPTSYCNIFVLVSELSDLEPHPLSSDLYSTLLYPCGYKNTYCVTLHFEGALGTPSSENNKTPNSGTKNDGADDEDGSFLGDDEGGSFLGDDAGGDIEEVELCVAATSEKEASLSLVIILLAAMRHVRVCKISLEGHKANDKVPLPISVHYLKEAVDTVTTKKTISLQKFALAMMQRKHLESKDRVQVKYKDCCVLNSNDELETIPDNFEFLSMPEEDGKSVAKDRSPKDSPLGMQQPEDPSTYNSPSAASSLPPLFPNYVPPGEKQCKECMVFNKADASKCIACAKLFIENVATGAAFNQASADAPQAANPAVSATAPAPTGDHAPPGASFSCSNKALGSTGTSQGSSSVFDFGFVFKQPAQSEADTLETVTEDSPMAPKPAVTTTAAPTAPVGPIFSCFNDSSVKAGTSQGSSDAFNFGYVPKQPAQHNQTEAGALETVTEGSTMTLYPPSAANNTEDAAKAKAVTTDEGPPTKKAKAESGNATKLEDDTDNNSVATSVATSYSTTTDHEWVGRNVRVNGSYRNMDYAGKTGMIIRKVNSITFEIEFDDLSVATKKMKMSSFRLVD